MIPKTQIRIENWIAPKDAKGDAKESIQFARNFWAQVVQQSGGRSETAGQAKLNKSMQFMIRFRPDWKLTGVWKVIYLGRRYTITDIQRVNEKRFNWIINGES